jgi:hypothetical protein
MTAYVTEHTYSSTESDKQTVVCRSNPGRRRRTDSTIKLLIWLMTTLVFLCGGVVSAQNKNKTQAPKTPPTPESEYAARFKSVETELASADKPYFVLDTKHSRLRLKVRGVTMRDYRYTLMSDSDEVAEFANLAISGDTLPKSLVRLHVFNSEPQLNDTVLGIVANATFAAPEVIQRYRPARLTATFGHRLVLDVTALDVNGTEASWQANLAENLRLFADDLMGGETLRIAIIRDDAMSFYGACQNVPALLIAP